MDDKAFTAWLQGYFDAWRSNNASDVENLFAPNAIYYRGPFTEPTRGRDGIVQRWVEDPLGQTDIHTDFEVLGVKEDQGIAHWRVSFKGRGSSRQRTELDGILLIRFDDEGKCVEHLEWFDHREIPA